MHFSIVAKRPARENIEKFLAANYALHGSKFLSFLFGEKMSKYIQDDASVRFKALASAFSGKGRIISVTTAEQ